jgi:hypothetical protein
MEIERLKNTWDFQRQAPLKVRNSVTIKFSASSTNFAQPDHSDWALGYSLSL